MCYHVKKITTVSEMCSMCYYDSCKHEILLGWYDSRTFRQKLGVVQEIIITLRYDVYELKTLINSTSSVEVGDCPRKLARSEGFIHIAVPSILQSEFQVSRSRSAAATFSSTSWASEAACRLLAQPSPPWRSVDDANLHLSIIVEPIVGGVFKRMKVHISKYN